MPQYESAEQYFDQMRDNITSEQAREIEPTYLFDIDGSGRYLMRFNEDGTLEELDEDAGVAPECTLMAKEHDWLKIVSGDTKPMTAFMTGKLKVKGSTGKALKLQQVL